MQTKLKIRFGLNQAEYTATGYQKWYPLPYGVNLFENLVRVTGSLYKPIQSKRGGLLGMARVFPNSLVKQKFGSFIGFPKKPIRRGNDIRYKFPYTPHIREYRFSRIFVEEAKSLLNGGFTSAVGHKSTAEILSSILGVNIPENRRVISRKVDK